MADRYVRRDVFALEQEQPWHPVLLAYALAVEVLRARPEDDPRSWAYQAAVHGTDVRPDRWRNQCQHFSWYFLPWHRLYLYWFERLVRSVVADLTEIDAETRRTWALPYWDYGRSPATARLPRAFRSRRLPDGRLNPLRVQERDPLVNGGGRLPPQVTSARFALSAGVFSAARRPGEPAGFGGPATGWHHAMESGFAVPGAVEATPHGVVHTGVGGDGGFMSGFDTAPLDPVFWLHHANIDRLWEVWRAQTGRRNPRQVRWLDQLFDFHDETGAPVRGSARDVRDPAEDLGYTYEDLSLPSGPLEAEMRAPEPTPDHPAELVGATPAPLELTGARRTVDLAIAPPGGPLAATSVGVPSRVYLDVEDVRAEVNPGYSYGVYVTVPDDDDLTDDRHHVGNVHFFGVEQTRGGRDREEHGLRFAFDITDLYRRLRDADRWTDQVSVTFEPLRPIPPTDDDLAEDLDEDDGEDAEDVPAGATASTAGVTLGRVSLYYQ